MSHHQKRTETRSKAIVRRVAFFFLGLTINSVVHADTSLQINPNHILRSNVPPSVFGFNIEWMGFDYGYIRNGAVRPELVAYLEPFRGAIYRYPGGTNSSYFDWRRSVGPFEKRLPQTNQWGTQLVVKFGLDEYLNFVQRVKGVPLVVLNAWGEKSGRHSEKEIIGNARDALIYVNGRTRVKAGHELDPCSTESRCNISLWQLGNEMDWPEQSLSATEYGALASGMATAMHAIDPNLVLLIGGKSSPWSVSIDDAKKFDKHIGHSSMPFRGALAYHLYYDGTSVPGVLAYLNRAIDAFAEGYGHGNFDVFITEHSRWPNRPRTGKWQDSWHKATDLSAAISTADFWLGALQNPKVKGLVWHALGAKGPWQLFSVDPQDDSLVPTAPYWAFRVLRAGFLDNVVAVSSPKTPNADYVGGYDVRLLAMSSKDERTISLLAVNRSTQPQVVSMRVAGWTSRKVASTHYQLSGADPALTANPRASTFVTMTKQIRQAETDGDGFIRHTLPGLSVNAIVIQLDGSITE